MQSDNIHGELSAGASLQGSLNNNTTRMSGALHEGFGGTSDYTELENKPSINGVTLEGDLSLNDLGILQPVNYSMTEQNTHVKWIDGKDIYIKSYSVSITSENVQIPLNVTVDTIVKLHSSIKKLTGDTYISADNIYYDGSDWINVHIYGDKIRILSTSWFNGASGYVTVYYTK